MNNAKNKLEQYLNSKNLQTNIEQLTPDASTREYFRIGWKDSSAIACVYPEPFSPNELPFLDVTKLFQRGKLPVPDVFGVSGKFGIVIQEDFGNRILREVLENSDFVTGENLIGQSIRLIAKIQSITQTAFEINSIASKLKFDEEKLFWELNFFKTHYFESFQKERLSDDFNKKITKEFKEISQKLENFARVLTHRDFHAANLMIDNENNLRIIDHQDARIGSVAYDLVSLLLDRVLKTPEKNWLDEKKKLFLFERENLGLEKIAFEKFDYEFDLMAVQRCLKAIGTFSNQKANLGKTGYTKFIKPMFVIILEACQNLARFPNLQNSIRIQINRL